jgi:hypothetical protein
VGDPVWIYQVDNVWIVLVRGDVKGEEVRVETHGEWGIEYGAEVSGLSDRTKACGGALRAPLYS